MTNSMDMNLSKFMTLSMTNSKGNQSWVFIGRTGLEAETPKPGPPDVKNSLIGKDPDVGKD